MTEAEKSRLIGEIEKQVEDLSARIAGAVPASGQAAIRAQVAQLTKRLKGAGIAPPPALAALDRLLAEAEMEARFDNLPL